MMTKLTETMIFQRTRKTDLKYVRELNCWGSDLTDVSIVRDMPNLRLLSLSVNRISTLEDFAYCSALEELYLRKNCVQCLSELAYLQELTNLRVLWLSDNPCSQSHDYRETVLRYLPNLQKLDNVAVSSEEVRQACRKSPVNDYHTVLPTSRSSSEPEEDLQCPTVQCDNKPKDINILQAILCLIKELDRDALEVVDDAVRNRLDMPSCS
jgi:hypothetical protein